MSEVKETKNVNGTYSIIAGLDIGNGRVKGAASVNGGSQINFDFDSVAAIETSSTGIKIKDSEAGSEIENVFDVLEASFDSGAVSSTARRLLGKRGANAGKATEEFDVASMVSKADQDLSGILALTSIAGVVLQQYWSENKKLPSETIKVSCKMALALPITEYKTHKKVYINKFKSTTHMVLIHNFETPVRVEIRFDDVQVVAEGAAAQFAIVNRYDDDLLENCLKELKTQGVNLDGVTANDIRQAQNTIGIDIGDGTVNFPVFQNGKLNPDVSMSFNKGYGTVLDQARDRLMSIGIPFPSRKALATYLLEPDTPLTRPRKMKVRGVVAEEVEGFVQELGLQFSKVMGRCAASTDVIYVYGGGSAQMKDTLYPALIDLTRKLGSEGVDYPIFYLPADKSRFLNREGLYWIADEIMK